MTCVLHHLENPESALLEMRRVLKPGGQIRLLLAHDPGFAYRVGWCLVGRRARLRWNLEDPDYAHAKGHLLSGLSIRSIIQFVFRNDDTQNFGTLVHYPFYHLNVSSIFIITKL